MRKRAKRPPKRTPAKAELTHRDKLPLIDHVHELRRRLFYVAACVAVGAAIAYGLERQLVSVLLRPSHGQQFIYTSPIGGMNFLFSVCLDIGLVLATPIIIYQLLAFLSPLMRNTTRRFILLSSIAAGFVALAGIVFGYFIGLPSALHFLLHQFTTIQIKPLITIQSYMSFVALYLFGSALMFQLPLILLIINRIKPLKPSGLLKYERHLIIFAFIAAFIMNPTPNIIDQMLVVVPILVMYQFGILLIWLVNRGHKPGLIEQLRAEDAIRQAERTSRTLEPLVAAEAIPELPIEIEATAEAETAETPEAPEQIPVSRPRQYAAAQPVARRSYVGIRGQLIQ